MTRTVETSEENIWLYLRGILCDASSAQVNCADILFDIPHALGYLTPLSGQKNFPADLAGFEKIIKTLEEYAAAGERSLSSVYRYTRLIKTTVNQIKEAKND
ncbi:hypothetical protein [Varibaculum cambriense]|uniref:hypothetical protein n=1 Tax=Varibaculum cambriense TaxID=184870 RepID=UPI00241C7B4E|nr:hypothetical protein [Varibaculum cambriense]MBS5944902.1 hypothetical protein [Varibaculum cambriense]